MTVKLDPFIADKRIVFNEARNIAKAAHAEAGNPLEVSAKTHEVVANVLANKDIFITPAARKILDQVAAAKVAEKAIDPTHKTKLFKTDEPMQLKLTADFAKLFAEKQGAGHDPGLSGTLQVGDKQIPVNVRTRGQSSLQYLPEPKIKLKLDKAARQGTDFENEGSLEIGVQGGKGGKDGLGRVLIPEAPPREAATYALLEEMGLPVSHSRLANFDYVDAQGVTRTQPAFLNEAVDSLAQRYYGDKGVALSEGAGGVPVEVTLQTKDVLRMNLGQLLIGNRDWSFNVNGDKSKPTVTANSGMMHNSKLIYGPDPIHPEGMPVAADFDLSLFVLQNEYGGYWKNHPASPTQPINYASELTQMRSQYPGPQFDEVLGDVIKHQETMLKRLDQYRLDDASKAFIRNQVTGFMTAAQAELKPAA